MHGLLCERKMQAPEMWVPSHLPDTCHIKGVLRSRSYEGHTGVWRQDHLLPTHLKALGKLWAARLPVSL